MTEVTAECDVIMKGGITSGVVYPKALARFARTYRLRRLGGASAGAIGAAFGAAAEHGRDSGGFDRLAAIPAELADGALASLFQPQPATRPMLRLMLAVTGHDRAETGVAAQAAAMRAAAPPARKGGPGRIVGALLAGWPGRAALGALPGVAVLAWAFTLPQVWQVAVGVLLGVAAMLLGSAAAVGVGVWRTLTTGVPGNYFGICTGLATGEAGPGFTDWLSQRLNTLAGRDAHDPLLYGHLWSGDPSRVAYVSQRDRAVDLRMVSTCLSQGRPYEMPWESRAFFYDPDEWRALFPAEVMDALDAAPVAGPPEGDNPDDWAWQEECAASNPGRPLRRLPAAEHLPVVVSVRMSLSFPLLISAVPLWTIDWRAHASQQARATGCAPEFQRLWFSDGGLCNNFPVHLFDDALPTRPTFAINLGSFVSGRTPDPDQSRNIEYARTNAPLLPSYRALEDSGAKAITGFALAMLATSREWQDGSQLGAPGMRDRIVRVLQSDAEGGLNLFMDGATIAGLADRGEAAADALTRQFTEPRYQDWTGWDNHRWVRYRALLAAFPEWLSAFREGREALGIDPARTPSYQMSARARALSREIDRLLDEAAALVEDQDRQAAVGDLTRAPRPLTRLRRVPQL